MLLLATGAAVGFALAGIIKLDLAKVGIADGVPVSVPVRAFIDPRGTMIAANFL